jgi:hypothetical protein
MKKPPDPKYGSVFFDSCAFDGGNEQEQAASNEARSLFAESGGEIKIVHSVKKEIDFPNTPQSVKDEANQLIYTIEVQLNPEEEAELNDVQNIIVGDGSLEKREADCRHVFEAIKYGRYFVTTDKGILNHSKEILDRFSTLFIVKPTEFLSIINDYAE